jgi:hypothetical protein
MAERAPSHDITFWQALCLSLTTKRESSLQVTKPTYSGLQEHRIIVYTAAGQKAKPKVYIFKHGDPSYRKSSKTPEACRRETEEHKLKTAVWLGGAQIEQARPLERSLRPQLNTNKQREHS